jgi:hypothetical protein
MKRKCLAWAKEHVKWTTVQWDSVMFCDESKFNVHDSDGKHYIWCRSNEACYPDCIEQTSSNKTGQEIVHLNPTRNCWHVISNKIADKKPTTNMTLQEVIISVWHHGLGSEYIKKQT